MHIVELKNQCCEVFYEKLKFIYIELPKFTKNLDQLESHFDKWMFLLRHLAELTDRPLPLQEGVFPELFAAAEIANFSPNEQETYQNSLKYYRDMNNVVDTARQEGRQEGIEQMLERQRSLLLRLLNRALGEIPDVVQAKIGVLLADRLDGLNEAFIDFGSLGDLIQWLD
jgi:predicted transposase/invertase (TIGR01784 family)